MEGKHESEYVPSNQLQWRRNLTMSFDENAVDFH